MRLKPIFIKLEKRENTELLLNLSQYWHVNITCCSQFVTSGCEVTNYMRMFALKNIWTAVISWMCQTFSPPPATTFNCSTSANFHSRIRDHVLEVGQQPQLCLVFTWTWNLLFLSLWCYDDQHRFWYPFTQVNKLVVLLATVPLGIIGF